MGAVPAAIAPMKPPPQICPENRRRSRPACVLASALLRAVAAICLLAAAPALAQRTVCTITVNSEDEKEVFRRYLPEPGHRFVELVERGRPDWLASACRARVTCDVLIISAHYDGGNDFFSDRLENNESLTVTELERASCSGSCPSLFSQLKEVYLFGCNTLNPSPQSGASAEIVRSLVRDGLSPKEAQRQLNSLTAVHGESSRDRMRQIFNKVPVIYGFASTAPLGPVAGATLNRHLRAAGVREIGQGRPSSRLVDAFASYGLTVTGGSGDSGPLAEARADMCQFADDRLSLATKLAFVHQVLQRHVGEARLQLDRIQRLTHTLDEATRRDPVVAQALEDIARDSAARTRMLDYAHGTAPSVQVRLLAMAHDVGWLSAAEQREELASMLRSMQGRTGIGVSEVDLACSLNRDRRLDGAFAYSVAPASLADDVAHAALRACLGSAEDRVRVLQALLGREEADLRIAQTYLRHRPITDAVELRAIAGAIGRMEPGETQVRALETLARHYVSDRQVLHGLVGLFSRTPSWAVQSAIAGVLIRADRRELSRNELLAVLTRDRRPAPDSGDDIVDALIRTLQSP
jgi:hypothetical protein